MTYTMKISEEEKDVMISFQKVDAILKAAKYINKNIQENNNSTNLRISRPCRSEMQGNMGQFNLSRGKESNCSKSSNGRVRAAWRPPGVVSRGVASFTVKRNNGYRSPPWREVYGDVAYFLISLENRDKPLSVTASTGGWFINGGFDLEQTELLYRQESETHPTLLSLLRKECQRFDAFLSSEEGMLQMYRMRWRLNAENKNEFAYEEPVRDSGISAPSIENKIIRRSSKSADPRRSNSRQRMDIISNMRSHHRSGSGSPILSPKGITKPSGDQKKKSFLPPIKLSGSTSNLRSTGSQSSEQWDIFDTNNSLLPSFLTKNANKNMNSSSYHSSQSMRSEVIGEQTEELIEDEITSSYQYTDEG
ncbi:unnamed protein product [Rodentolepis nana]|uniref:IRS-type PTB domain-containing protein n=1 Tax=Rodentolepis nana TaxID=102285 RepID=A0A158QH68_RODNA|nr:unnamed protein product [Rodentolepis nana]